MFVEDDEVIIEEPEVVEESTDAEDLEGISSEEKEMAEKFGLVPKKPKEDSKEETKETQEEFNIDASDFEELYNDRKKRNKAFYEWNQNPEDAKAQQAKKAFLDWKSHRTQQDKEKSQEAIAQSELLKVQLKAQQEELEQLKKQFAKKDDAELDDFEEKKYLTEEDLAKREQEKQRKQQETDQERQEKALKLKQHLDGQLFEAKQKYKDYDQVVNLAKEVLENDLLPDDYPFTPEELKNRYSEKLMNMESDLADFAYKIGKLHPNYSKSIAPKGEETKNKDIDKLVANAEKRSSSASLGGGAGGNRKASLEDISVEAAAKLSTEQWRKLPKNVKDRILREAS